MNLIDMGIIMAAIYLSPGMSERSREIWAGVWIFTSLLALIFRLIK